MQDESCIFLKCATCTRTSVCLPTALVACCQLIRQQFKHLGPLCWGQMVCFWIVANLMASVKRISRV